ncbi:MAG: hypothetical protein IJJ77_00880 [Paludibacteraceae bacterium]|nr:hypothetical protein [Paludibacteraceae bacterium]
MKKIILSVVVLMLAFVASAATLMKIKLIDNREVVYNIEDVETVDYSWYTYGDEGFRYKLLAYTTYDKKYNEYEVDDIVEVVYEDIPLVIDEVETANQGITVSGKIGNYTYVDLGLPSGLLWATYNVGATKPGALGDCFAWAETEKKGNYDWSNLKYYDENEGYFKYYDSDGKKFLDSEDDVATVQWGEEWRMPDCQDLYELVAGCTWTWTGSFKGTGVCGKIGVSKTNGNKIFIPAGGHTYGSNRDNKNYYGYYWLNTLHKIDYPHCFFFGEEGAIKRQGTERYTGCTIRAVAGKKVERRSPVVDGISVSGTVGNYTYVDLALPSGIKWATCNVGASKPTESGAYYAWGETTEKDTYSWATYKWCEGMESTLTKYCSSESNGVVDGKKLLDPEDDVATVQLGEEWRMPTENELKELYDGCNWSWTDDFNGTGVPGSIGISRTNYNIIFLPAAGYYTPNGNPDGSYGKYGVYWGSEALRWNYAVGFCVHRQEYFDEIRSDNNVENNVRNNGLTVRAVTNK